MLYPVATGTPAALLVLVAGGLVGVGPTPSVMGDEVVSLVPVDSEVVTEEFAE